MMKTLRDRCLAAVLIALWGAAGSTCAAEAGDAVLSATIIDADTGLPAHCTVAVVNALGDTVEDNPSFSEGFRSDGRFRLNLPAGETRIRVTRGYETRAVERVLDLPAGKTTDLRVKLERVVDLRKQGWFSGENHAHMNHGEKIVPVDFDYVALAARAEDLQYLCLAQTWSMEDPTPERLESELQARSTPDCILAWNLEAPKNFYQGDAGRCLGHCWMLGVKGRTPEGKNVIDLLLNASAHDYESDKPTYANFESHHLIRAQGGVSSYTHPARWWTGSWGGRAGFPYREKMRISNLAVELPLDVLLGPTFDAIDLITGPREFTANAKAFELWSLLLNRGYRLAGTASTDACFDRIGGAIPGVARTYTHIEGQFTIDKAARALATGRNFVTTGPLLLVSVDGKPPGEVFRASDHPRALRIEAWASGADFKGLTRIELLRNGKPIQTHNFSTPMQTWSTNAAIAEGADGWYCVKAFGGDPQRQRAISGAFFFETPDFLPPKPLSSRVTVTLRDGNTGKGLSGRVTEMTYHATLARPGPQHELKDGELVLEVPSSVRLRAEAPGYFPQTLSLFLDHAELASYVTELSAEDLLDWGTYDRIRAMLENTKLIFNLQPRVGGIGEE